jgi:DUF5010 C-terminal domain
MVGWSDSVNLVRRATTHTIEGSCKSNPHKIGFKSGSLETINQTESVAMKGTPSPLPLIAVLLVASSKALGEDGIISARHLRHGGSAGAHHPPHRSLQQARPVVPFDLGATQYTAFQDSTPQHIGNCHSGYPVDASRTKDAVCVARGGSCAVSAIRPTEWLNYDFTVPAGVSNVDIVLRISSTSVKRFTVFLDSGAASATLVGPGRGYNVYADVVWSQVAIPAPGNHSVQVYFDNGNINFCSISVHQGGTLPPPPTATAPRHVKLYWEPGYTWQEETFERKWCLECDAPGCLPGSYVKLRPCDEKWSTLNDVFQFIPVPNATGIAMIRDPTFDTCLSGRRLGSTINSTRWNVTMSTCSSSSLEQRWWTAGNGHFWAGRFEIQPAGTTDQFCLKSHHHPTPGEVLKLESCRLARIYQTSYWVPYDPVF